KQETLIRAQARMGRLVATADHLIDRGYLMSLGVNGKAADLAHHIAAARAVFVDGEQMTLIFGQRQPGRIFTLDHLQRLGVELASLTVETITVDAFAGTLGI